MTIKLYGTNPELLKASDADLRLDYNLLTYGEEGFTSAGRVTVDPGSLEIPAGHLPVNDEHLPDRPTGYMEVTDEPERILASVHYFHTDEGRAAYTEAKEGKRRGISVEVARPVIKAGKLLAGALCGAGVVKKPAFASSLLLAADYSEEETPAASAEDAAEAVDHLQEARDALDAGDLDGAAAAVAAAQETLTDDENTDNPDEEEEPTMPKTVTAAAASPAQLLASLLSGEGAPAPEQDDALTLPKFTASFREAVQGEGKLKASHLETLTQTDLYDPAAVPAYLGELWQESPYDEIWSPLVSHEGLTALSYKGYRWVEGSSPLVDDWDPAFTDYDDEDNETPGHAHMNPIPTSRLRLENKEFFAKRLAGGNRFDRAPVLDFPVPGVMESYLRLQTEGIKRKRDARVRSAVLAQAALHPLKPGRFTSRDLDNPFRRIILGAMSVRKYGKPTFAILGNDLYRDMLGTDMLENLALLEKSLGLEGGSMAGFTIAPADIEDEEMDGRVIVGVGRSVVLHEPAGAPIRVDAQELSVGAVDKAVFSYYMIRADDRGGIVEVPGGDAA